MFFTLGRSLLVLLKTSIISARGMVLFNLNDVVAVKMYTWPLHTETVIVLCTYFSGYFINP